MSRALAAILALVAMVPPEPRIVVMSPEPEPGPDPWPPVPVRLPEALPTGRVLLPAAVERRPAHGAIVDRSIVWSTRCHRCRMPGPQHAPRTVVRTTRSGRAVEAIVCDVGLKTRET